MLNDNEAKNCGVCDAARPNQPSPSHVVAHATAPVAISTPPPPSVDGASYWSRVALCPQGTVQLYSRPDPRSPSKQVEVELEILKYTQVSVYIGEKKIHRHGSCTVTTHRLIWQSAATPSKVWQCMLADVRKAETRSGFLIGSPKITLYLHTRSNQGAPVPDYMYLSFKVEDRDAFLSAIQGALCNTAWLDKGEKLKEGFSTSRAGIGGVVRRVEKEHRETDKALQSAFSDLDALMANAKDIVKLADKFARSESQGKDAEEFNSLLHNMGISHPVTRKSAGSVYHSELAQQLATFMKEPLERTGGMITLTAAYCIFNRARGTELISPEDITNACRLFPELGIPIRLHSFDSGFMVLQSDSHSLESLTKSIMKAVESSATGFSASDVADSLQMSLVLAKQHLIAAEQTGLLCRDETLEEVRFYINFFV